MHGCLPFLNGDVLNYIAISGMHLAMLWLTQNIRVRTHYHRSRTHYHRSTHYVRTRQTIARRSNTWILGQGWRDQWWLAWHARESVWHLWKAILFRSLWFWNGDLSILETEYHSWDSHTHIQRCLTYLEIFEATAHCVEAGICVQHCFVSKFAHFASDDVVYICLLLYFYFEFLFLLYDLDLMLL